MRIPYTLFLAQLIWVCLVASAQPMTPLPPGMYGEWLGTVSSANETYPIEVVVTATGVSVRYPSRQCDGEWKQAGGGGRGAVNFEENITSGPASCAYISRGIQFVVAADEPTPTEAQFYRNLGRGIRLAGTLTRRGSVPGVAPVRVLAPLPPGLMGQWAGETSGRYPIEIEITETRMSAKYPSHNCVTEWKYIRSPGGGSYMFQEEPTSGGSNCKNPSGTVTINFGQDNPAPTDVFFRRQGGDQARATLTRPVDHRPGKILARGWPVSVRLYNGPGLDVRTLKSGDMFQNIYANLTSGKSIGAKMLYYSAAVYGLVCEDHLDPLSSKGYTVKRTYENLGRTEELVRFRLEDRFDRLISSPPDVKPQNFLEDDWGKELAKLFRFNGCTSPETLQYTESVYRAATGGAPLWVELPTPRPYPANTIGKRNRQQSRLRDKVEVLGVQDVLTGIIKARAGDRRADQRMESTILEEAYVRYVRPLLGPGIEVRNQPSILLCTYVTDGVFGARDYYFWQNTPPQWLADYLSKLPADHPFFHEVRAPQATCPAREPEPTEFYR